MDQQPKPSGWGQRHTITAMGFCGFVMSYLMRFNLSIAIVAMVNRTAVQEHTQLGLHPLVDYCNESTSELTNGVKIHPANQSMANLSKLAYTTLIEVEKEGEFHWSEYDQGIILGAFFWGYLTSQLPGGWIGHHFGGKWPYGVGLLATGVLSFLIPMAANMGMGWLIFIRIAQGLGEGVTPPSMHCLLAKWVPPVERGQLTALAYCGTTFGSAISMLFSGYIIFYFGWPWVFYSSGAVTVIWFFFWTYLVYSTPEEHPRISKAELKYLKEAINRHVSSEDVEIEDERKGRRVGSSPPWKEIITSVPFWALFVGFISQCWGHYTIMAELPTYMKTALHFGIKENSLLNTLPHLLELGFAILLTQIGDYLIGKGYCSTGTVRKTNNSIALWGCGALLVIASYTGCHKILTVVLITIGVGLRGGAQGGVIVNVIDLAPNYAGILMGLINTVGSVVGAVAPWVAGIIINESPTLDRWRIVFLLIGGISLVGNLVFVVYGSGEEQSWNKPKTEVKNQTTEESKVASDMIEIK